MCQRFTEAQVQALVRFVRHYDRWAVADGFDNPDFHKMVEAREWVDFIPFAPHRGQEVLRRREDND